MTPATPHPDLGEHARRITSIAATGLAGTPALSDTPPDDRLAYLNGFRDEFLNRRATDRPLLARVLGVDPGPAPGRADAPARAWWALHDRSLDPADFLPGLDADPEGPLVHDPNDSSVAIEWRTLDELAALHALWDLSGERARADWRARCLGAARWHLGELQPDNATNQPWAVHVFLVLAAVDPDADTRAGASFHAQTLLHACQVQQGRPDLVSGFVLLDAARMLEREARRSDG
ncbi:MAG: hypothetical protein ACF8Q5_13090 [Phycisphaerales bacterium JB040]